MPARKVQRVAKSDHPQVLVVDDDAAALEALMDVLIAEGYTVAPARNGKEALNYLRHTAPPAVIILDLFMPEMDGWEFRRAQKKEAKLAGVPVIAVTGASVYAGIDVDVVIHKPIDVDHLLGLIKHYV